MSTSSFSSTNAICYRYDWRGLFKLIVWHSVKAKLEAGVRLNQHMTSYGDRPNDYDSVSTCNRFLFYRMWWHLTFSLLDFRNKFGVIHHSYTPNKEREFYSTFNTTALIVNKFDIYWAVHLTAVTDTRRTTVIISSGTFEIWSYNTSTLIPFDISARYDYQRKLARYETRLIKKPFSKLLHYFRFQELSLFSGRTCCN